MSATSPSRASPLPGPARAMTARGRRRRRCTLGARSLDSVDVRRRARSSSAFERGWARYCGTPHAVGVANGTDAIAADAAGARRSGRATRSSCPRTRSSPPPRRSSWPAPTPRFADVDPDTLLVTAETVDGGRSPPRPRPSIAVHLYGQMPDMDALARSRARTASPSIEDAAQAHGAAWRGRRAGVFGVAAASASTRARTSAPSATPARSSPPTRSWPTGSARLRDHGRAAGDALRARPRRHATAGSTPCRPPSSLRSSDRLDAWNAARGALAARYRRRWSARIGRPSGPRARQARQRAPPRRGPRRATRPGARAPGRARRSRPASTTRCRATSRRRTGGSPTGRCPWSRRAAGELLSLPLFPHHRRRQVAESATVLTRWEGPMRERSAADAGTASSRPRRHRRLPGPPR